MLCFLSQLNMCFSFYLLVKCDSLSLLATFHSSVCSHIVLPTQLHRLESKTVSPPTKAAGLKKHHSDPVVTFVTPTHPSPPRTSVSTGHVTSRVPGILKSSSSRENKKESVYVVEPPVLNVTSREDTKCAQEAGTQTQHGGTVGVQRSPSSNPTAVFGPPVAFEGSRSTDTKVMYGLFCLWLCTFCIPAVTSWLLWSVAVAFVVFCCLSQLMSLTVLLVLI